MRQITFSQATLEAMAEEMRRDERIFVMGEDIVRQGGIFGQFKGLPDEFGDRIMDTPISETDENKKGRLITPNLSSMME
jgi:pyruvate/2-oxoglutarate/acetoin dehydrogenase E1 component